LPKITEENISEEPSAGNLHAGICAGVTGQPEILP